MIAMGGKYVELMDITVGWAELMLSDVKIRNRRVRPTRVKKYSRAMAEGRWKLNGETVKIRTDGSMGDGRHRMLAVLAAQELYRELTGDPEAELVVPMFVMFGAKDEDMDTVDTGANRNFRDTLEMDDQKWPSGVAPAMVLLGTHLNNQWKTVGSRGDNDELKAKFKDHYGLADWISTGEAVYRACNLNKTASTVAGYLIGEGHGNDEAVKEFYEGLVSGAGLEIGNPILALRKYGITQAWRMMNDTRGGQKRVLISTIKAFNYWKTGHELRLMKVLAVQDVPEVVKSRE